MDSTAVRFTALAALLTAFTVAGAEPAVAVSGGAYSTCNNELGKGNRLLPTAGALLIPVDGDTVDDDNAEIGCSATLIGCRTVLTAAHCVEEVGPAGIQVLLRHGGIYPVTDIAVHPRYERDDADVAVLRLGEPVTGIAPSRINDRVAGSTLAGNRGVIAGYGIASNHEVDSGIQRSGVVETGSCSELSEGELSDRRYLCWQYDGPLGAPGHRANTCNGDSGGPLFMNVDGEVLLVGVTSGGSGASCGAEEVSYNADVYTWRSFVQSYLEGETAEACGDLPVVGAAGATVVDRAGSLAAGREVRYGFHVGPGARELRLVLNGQDDGEFDPDLYAVRGDGPGERFDCARDGASAFAACRLVDPAPGDWTVVVRAAAGEGLYQLTGTVFGASLVADAGDERSSDGEVWAAVHAAAEAERAASRTGKVSSGGGFHGDAAASVAANDAFGSDAGERVSEGPAWDTADESEAFAVSRSRAVERRSPCEACKDPEACLCADGSLGPN